MRIILVAWVVAYILVSYVPTLVPPVNNDDRPRPLDVDVYKPDSAVSAVAAAFGSVMRAVNVVQRGWALEVVISDPLVCHRLQVLLVTLWGVEKYGSLNPLVVWPDHNYLPNAWLLFLVRLIRPRFSSSLVYHSSCGLCRLNFELTSRYLCTWTSSLMGVYLVFKE